MFYECLKLNSAWAFVFVLRLKQKSLFFKLYFRTHLYFTKQLKKYNCKCHSQSKVCFQSFLDLFVQGLNVFCCYDFFFEFSSLLLSNKMSLEFSSSFLQCLRLVQQLTTNRVPTEVTCALCAFKRSGGSRKKSTGALRFDRNNW